MFILCPSCLNQTEILEDKYILVLTSVGKIDTVIQSYYCKHCDKLYCMNENVIGSEQDE